MEKKTQNNNNMTIAEKNCSVNIELIINVEMVQWYVKNATVHMLKCSSRFNEQ